MTLKKLNLYEFKESREENNSSTQSVEASLKAFDMSLKKLQLEHTFFKIILLKLQHKFLMTWNYSMVLITKRKVFRTILHMINDEEN